MTLPSHSTNLKFDKIICEGKYLTTKPKTQVYSHSPCCQGVFCGKEGHIGERALMLVQHHEALVQST